VVLNGVFGSVNRGGLGAFQKGAFLEGLALCRLRGLGDMH
jgi:hypothetical protein